jgi:hypothetical protein
VPHGTSVHVLEQQTLVVPSLVHKPLAHSVGAAQSLPLVLSARQVVPEQ